MWLMTFFVTQHGLRAAGDEELGQLRPACRDRHLCTCLVPSRASFLTVSDFVVRASKCVNGVVLAAAAGSSGMYQSRCCPPRLHMVFWKHALRELRPLVTDPLTNAAFSATAARHSSRAFDSLSAATAAALPPAP